MIAWRARRYYYDFYDGKEPAEEPSNVFFANLPRSLAALPSRCAELAVQRTFDREMYKARHLIENFFCQLKRYRAIATRYDKTARNFLAAIHLTAAIRTLLQSPFP